MVNRQARSVARVNVHCDINMIRRIKGAVEDSLFLYVRRLPHFLCATAPLGKVRIVVASNNAVVFKK